MKRYVLLSGGLDSTAAACRANEQGGDVEAIAFDYGQPARDAEIVAAGRVAARLGMPLHVLKIIIEGWHLNPEPGRSAVGVSRAFLPGRNALFIVNAAAFAAVRCASFALVLGVNSDDFAAFPDCRGAFFEAALRMLRAMLVGHGDCIIETPWVNCSKAMILRWCLIRPEALEAVRASVSCYRGTRCGQCDACTLRTAAFAEVGIEDGAGEAAAMFGGDPQRVRL